MTARALITEGQVARSFAYSKALIQRLKSEIAIACCTFNPETKVWTVHEPYIMPAVVLVYAVYPGLVIDDQRGTRASWRPPDPTRLDPAYAALHLLPTAPAPLVDAAYKCLARLHHPDAGGNTLSMQQLNAARKAIRARRAS